MKLIISILLISAVLFSNDYYYRYTVDNDENSTVPTAVIEAINEYRGDIEPCHKYEGIPIDLNGDGEENSYIVQGSGGCSAASADPVYLVQKQDDNSYEILLFKVTYSVDFLSNKTNGFYDIKTSRGTASVYECEFWEFDGQTYDTTKTYFITSDEGNTCKKYPGICPWVCE